jgi:hypothetical protein
MLRGALKIYISPAVAIAAIALSPLLCLAAREFVMPQAEPAKTYPAHDQHPAETVTVAVDPYDLAEKTTIFSVHYSELGFLPIFVVVTNDGSQAVELSGIKAQLVTVNRAKLSPATQEDIARRITRPSANTNRYPIPFPTKKVKGGMNKQAIDEIQNAQFVARRSSPIVRNLDSCSSMSPTYPYLWLERPSTLLACAMPKGTS